MNKQKAILKVLIITFILNIMIAISKLVYGYWSHTFSMIADGFHSLMDSTSNIVGIVAILYAFKPPDEEHPYGHSKAEIVASMLIAILLALTCFEVLQKLIDRLTHPQTPTINWMAFGIMLMSVGINTLVTLYETKKGKELNSPILLSDAEHTKSDILVSLSVFVSLVGIHYKIFWLDIVVSIGIIGFIGYTAYSLFKLNMLILIDTIPINSEKIARVVHQIEGVRNCHKIRSHGTPEMIFVDLHIWVDPTISIIEAHKISHQVKSSILTEIGTIKDVTIHVEPAET